MSKIEELIQKYCQDGVEYKRFGDIATLEKGKGLQKTDFTDEGIGCIHYGQIYTHFGISTTETLTCTSAEKAKKFTVVHPGDIVMASTSENVEDCGKSVVWLGSDDIVTGGHSIVIRTKQNPMYLAYVLQTPWFQKQKVKKVYGVKVIEFKPDELADIVIPVPPLPVQQEIVRILDSFTALQDELQKELEERKKQYLFISNTTFGSARMRYVELQEICKIVDCPHSSPKWKSNGIPVIRNYNLVNGRIDTSNLSYVSELDYESRTKRIVPQSGDVLFSREAPIGSLGIIPDNFICCQGQRVVLLRPNKREVNSIYLVHALRSQYVQDQCKKKDIVSSTVGNFGIAELKKLLVPMPLSIKEQLKISDSLETIDQLSFNKNGELAKEILLRQQQYSYYRDKLLNFPRKEA